MTKAVTVFSCGHIFNEDTIIQCLARDRLCPLDRQSIERYVPNYNMRRLAETADEHALKDEGTTEEAITDLLKALQLCPTYEEAQIFLNFCLKNTSTPPAAALPLQLSPQAKPCSIPLSKDQSKEKYTDLLLNLLEAPPPPPIQKDLNLK